MSRLTTKQRRARLWRREWHRDYREIAARTEPGFPVPVWLMVEYAHELVRSEEPVGMGLRYPQQRERWLERSGRRAGRGTK